jgi:hypothetical protein
VYKYGETREFDFKSYIVKEISILPFSNEHYVVLESDTNAFQGFLYQTGSVISLGKRNNMNTKLKYSAKLAGGNAYQDQLTYYVYKNEDYQYNCEKGVLTFKVCGAHCLACAGGENSAYVCTTCEPNYGFLDSNNLQCVDKREYPDYYRDPTTHQLLPCYDTCETCNEEGNEEHHHCTKCKSDYSYSMKATSNAESFNCYSDHDKRYYLIEGSKDLVISCDSDKFKYEE